MATFSPWEQRKSYYNNLELGKNVKSLTATLNTQTKAMLAAQMASANAVVASQDRIIEIQGRMQGELMQGFDDLAIGLDRVCDGIYGLQAAFEWGIGEIVWQIEQNREVLKSILEVLSAPLDTHAKELRKRAEEAYQNNWIDDALTDFLDSEIKNRYDFSVHISIGTIYLFHKDDRVNALESFEKAIKYARPKSAYHTSYSLLYKGVIKYSQAKYEEAIACVKEAVELTPNFTEGYFQKAQYLAALGRQTEMLTTLKQTILMDKYYCIKAEQTEDFKPYMDSIYGLIKGLKDDIAHQVRSKLAQLVNNNEILAGTKQPPNIKPLPIHHLERGCEKLSNYLTRDSYFDLLDARELANNIIKSQNEMKTKVKKNLEYKINTLKSTIDSETRRVTDCFSYNEKGYPKQLAYKAKEYTDYFDSDG